MLRSLLLGADEPFVAVPHAQTVRKKATTKLLLSANKIAQTIISFGRVDCIDSKFD
jgi:hypothetical protein